MRPLALLLPVLAACASTGSVTARSEISQPMSSYDSAAFSVEAADPSMTNAAMRVQQARDAVSAKLHASGVFANVYGAEQAGDAKLLVRVRLLEIVDASKDLMAGGVSRVKLEVDLFDKAKSSSVGLLDVEGNSEKNTETSIGGVSTDAMDDTVKRAIDNAAIALADYLKK